jgi:hypothetical protein
MRTLRLLLTLMLCNSAAAETYLVGDTDHDGCDFSTIQEAIDAAAANGFYGNKILVANTGTYANQALQIADTTLIIEGGYDSCVYRRPAAQADLGGNGTEPVIRIAPASPAVQSVSLYNLHIHGGGSSGMDGSLGGGIYVTNNVRVYTFSTWIDGNVAVSGGGIYMDADHGNPYVQLNRGTRISGNDAAFYGGGVYLSGGRIEVVADQVSIDHNQANDAGGGIAATNGYVYVGNPWNESSAAATGAIIAGNNAGAIGGGIFVSGSSAILDANELIVDGNSAAVAGGGIAASAAAHVGMRRDYELAALQCPDWRECSRISNNSAGASANGTLGGAIALYQNSVADIAQTIIRGNASQSASVAYVSDSTLYLEGALVTANKSVDTASKAGTVISTQFTDVQHPATVRIAFSTFAGNQRQQTDGGIGAALDVVAQQYGALSIFSSALYDGYYGVTTYSAYTDDCVVAVGDGDFYGTHTRFHPFGGNVFNNAPAGDYRLRSESLLNDYCDASAYAPAHRDLVLSPRCHGDPRKPDTYGTCDVGAYESDHLFGSGMQ